MSQSSFVSSAVCEGRGEIGFLVDSSSIVPGAEFIRALQLVKALSRGFEGKETQIGLVAYGGEAKKAFDLEVIVLCKYSAKICTVNEEQHLQNYNRIFSLSCSR